MDTSSPSLSFEPAQITTNVQNTFNVTVNIFTGEKAAISSDVWISYNPELITPKLPVKNGNSFALIDAKILAPGKLYLYGIQADKTIAQAKNGAFATLTFEGKKEGIVTLRFDCASGEQSSQIVKNSDTLENIIDCTATANHTSTVQIHQANVLGTNDMKSNPINMVTLSAMVIVLIMTALLFMRYKKLS